MTDSRGLPKPVPNRAQRARERQDQLTKPPGSLGRLEKLAVDMAAFQEAGGPWARPAAALLFAADHPVTRHGVSPYPKEVTRAMLRNFADGGAAACVLSRGAGVPLRVIDVGVEGGSEVSRDEAEGGSRVEVAQTEVAQGEVAQGEVAQAEVVAVLDWNPRGEAGDIRVEDALSVVAFEPYVELGRRAVREQCPGARVLLLGEMGIGNTTVAAAVTAALLGLDDPATAVGRGTGADHEVLEQKRQVVRDAVARVGGERDPVEVLRRLGGRELVALFGAFVEALGRRTVIVVDGFIVTAVALAVERAYPGARAGMVFAHRSAEAGHGALLEALGAEPLLDLGLRLGEGSGALTAYPLVEQALRLHHEMATFEGAAVPREQP